MVSPFGILVKSQNFSFQKNLWCCCTNGVMCVYREKTQAATPCIMERVKTISFLHSVYGRRSCRVLRCEQFLSPF